MSRRFWKGLTYALAITLTFYWLPFAYTWFVLHAPWWLALLIAFGVLYFVLRMEARSRP